MLNSLVGVTMPLSNGTPKLLGVFTVGVGPIHFKSTGSADFSAAIPDTTPDNSVAIAISFFLMVQCLKRNLMISYV